MSKNRIYGIGEPIWTRDLRGEINGLQTIDIIDAIGFGSLREWMHIPDILENPTTPKVDLIPRITAILDRCVELDIEVTGMSHVWFLPEGCHAKKGHKSPDRDHTSGSLYMQMLEMLEESWYTLVKLFPQIQMWQTGNEWNGMFLTRDNLPNDDTNFTLKQRMEITADMMYYATKGIRRANPNAKSVMVPPCPNGEDLPFYLPGQYGIAHALDLMYQVIANGESFSTNTDDYFDIGSWHPYYPHDIMPDDVWKEINDAAYRVMQKYGDGDKKVIVTEFGYTDGSNHDWSCDPEKEKLQSTYYARIFEYLKDMPYIYAFDIFRLYEDYKAAQNWKPGQWGGIYEQYFGIFREPINGLTPRTKAIEIQKLTGSSKDLWQFSKNI